MLRENIPAVAHHLREYIAMSEGTSAKTERIFQVAAVKGNEVIVQHTTITARDHQHALVKTAALVSGLRDEEIDDAGAADVRYLVSEVHDTKGSNNGH